MIFYQSKNATVNIQHKVERLISVIYWITLGHRTFNKVMKSSKSFLKINWLWLTVCLSVSVQHIKDFLRKIFRKDSIVISVRIVFVAIKK